MSSYLILYGGGALTLLWWLLNFIVLVIYFFRENRKISTMCIYIGLLPFILILPIIVFFAFGWAGMGFREGPKPGVFEYIGEIIFTFVLFFCGITARFWYISVPFLLLIIYGIYRWRNDKLQKP
jgi:hypothetical protein